MFKKQLDVWGHWKEGSNDCEQAQWVELKTFLRKQCLRWLQKAWKEPYKQMVVLNWREKDSGLKQKECVVGSAFLERRAL